MYPVPYEDWPSWRRREHLAGLSGEWETCPICWGQRRILQQTPEGLVPLACQRCLGVGEVTPNERRLK